jgi:hypothetical protein
MSTPKEDAEKRLTIVSESISRSTSDRSSPTDDVLSEKEQQRIWRKIDWRVVPLASLLYLLSFL